MTETIAPPQTGTFIQSTTGAWLRVTRWAALVITAWSVTLQLLAGQVIPPVAVIGAVFAVLAMFLQGERRRLGLVAAGLAALAVGGNLPGIIDDLANPSTAPAFLLTLVAVSSVVVVIVSGVSAFRGGSTDPAKALYYGWAGVVAVGVVVAMSAASGVESASPLAGDVEVVARAVEFDTDRIVVPAGESGFWLDNQDGVRHTFTIEGTGYEIDAPGLSSQRAEFDLAPGRYEVICAVPGHENMRIDLVVEG